MRTYKPGQWLAVCDRCGFEFLAKDLKKDWQGLMVCSHDYELRNPQDFIRVRPEKITPPWTRPEPLGAFLETMGLFDTFTVTDSDGPDYIDPTYFLEDYMQDQFSLIMQYVRQFSDTLPVTDSVENLFNKGLADTAPLSDNLTSVLWANRDLADTVVLDDAGTLFFNDYIDPTYFAEQYVGTETLFT